MEENRDLSTTSLDLPRFFAKLQSISTNTCKPASCKSPTDLPPPEAGGEERAKRSGGVGLKVLCCSFGVAPLWAGYAGDMLQYFDVKTVAHSQKSPSPSNPPALAAEAIEVAYPQNPNSPPLIQDLSLKVNAGELIAVVG